jgi:hypothetical protein
MTIIIEKGPSGRTKALRSLLSGLTREDVLGVLPQYTLESVAQYGFIDSTDYDLVHDGKNYPPKAILGLAAKRIVGRELTSDEFTGGEKSACFAILTSLGFEIRRKDSLLAPSYVPDRLALYQQYDRKDISQIFEPGATYTSGSGRWGISGIVETPKGSRNFVFLVTLDKPHNGNPYKDELTEDGFLIWESQNQHTINWAVIQKLLNHNAQQHNIHLFLRPSAHSKYTYFGLLQYFSHDPNSSKPVHFIWSIRSWDLNINDLISLGFPYRGPLDPAYTPPEIDITDKRLLKVDPPNSQRKMNPNKKKKQVVNSNSSDIDWATQDEKNRRLGLEGEKLVLKYEIAMLKTVNRDDLANQVKHVALYNSTAGFDILSFHPDGKQKRIEVKTTQGPSSTPFFISVNEVLTSREDPESYWIYRVFNYDKSCDQINFFQLHGDVERCCELKAVNFQAYPTRASSEDFTD